MQRYLIIASVLGASATAAAPPTRTPPQQLAQARTPAPKSRAVQSPPAWHLSEQERAQMRRQLQQFHKRDRK